MNTSDSIGFGTLIVTIIAGVILPFIQVPLLGYGLDDSTESKNNDFVIKIHNYGLAAANSILLSFDSKNSTITNVQSKPFPLENSHVPNSNYMNQRYDLLKIDFLPPQAEMKISLSVNSTGKIPLENWQPTVYLWSNEAIGHPIWYVNMILLSVAIFLGGSVFLFVKAWLI